MLPLVSVIVPLYNGSRYLKEALDSIFAQSYSQLEVIVVDDGSTDGSSQIAQSYPQVIYLYQENRGNALARMRGIERAAGTLIAFLDQDDFWCPNKIALQVHAFLQDPTCQCVVGKAHYFLDEASPPPPLKQVVFEQDRVSYLPGVLMAKKELLQRIPFDPCYSSGSDTEWFFRLKEAEIPVTELPDLLLHARMHGGNLSHDLLQRNMNLLHIAKYSAARKSRAEPFISVIIPVYNGEKHLKEALESVFAQTGCALEVIVVDDGSTDASRQVALQFKEKIRYVFQQHGGIGKARNRGVQIATGEYLAFLDCDDLWPPNKLSEQIALFADNPRLEMVFGKLVHFFSPELPPEVLQKYRADDSEIVGLSAGTLLVKKQSFQKVGPFDLSLQVGEFIHWYMQAKKAKIVMQMSPTVVLKRRIHGENTTLKQKKNQSDYLRVIRAHLESGLAKSIKNFC